MLASSHRLSLRQQRSFFSQSSRVFISPLRWIVGKEVVPVPQVACVVPKAIVKSAVARNALKRNIYTVIEKKMSSLPARQLVVYVQRPIQSKKHLDESVTAFCRRTYSSLSIQ